MSDPVPIPLPDTHAAVAFLRWAREAGPWVLTAIPAEREGGRTTTETFTDQQLLGLEKFIERFNGKQNLYWMVNPARGPLNNKASKEDVEALEFLHVDIDPDKGKEIEVERARILPKLRAFVPPPSAIIDSGGGFQGFWRLDEALHVGGDPVRTADAEAYNQQLELLLGGDHCHNCDRIMRLPGTVNLPNEKKRKVGRVKALARVVELTDHEWPLADFTPAQRVQAPGARGGPTTVQISGNLTPILVEDLPERVTLRTRMLIVQGDDPDDQTRYGSRSDVVWAVLCEMIRAGCEDDTIASVLLDPDYAISAHVLAQRRPQDYVARQLQRAHEEVEEPLLRRLNEDHAVIEDLGGKCRIISEVMDISLDPPRTRISKQSFEDFRNRYMHQKVQVGTDKEGKPIYKPAGAWWLTHPMRRQYKTMVFAPGREIPDAYNLWQGFACEAIPGKNHEPFLEHVFRNICSGDQGHYDYVVRWMARCVQNPGEAGQVAIVLRGGMGVGKGTFAHGFGSLWGRHYLQVSSAKHLTGQFNAHLRDCVVLFADEAFFAGDKQHEGTLRALVTEPTIVVEGKGIDAEIGLNTTHLIVGGNKAWLVPAGHDERRFLVLDVAEEKKQDLAYFKAVTKALKNGGRESLLHFLLTYELDEFEVRAVPKTAALGDQKVMSLTPEEQWWLERLMDGRTLSTSPDWQTSVLKDRVTADYLRYAESQRIMRRAAPVVLGKFLSSIMPKDDTGKPLWPKSFQRTTEVEKDDGKGHTHVVRERAYWYDIPDLEACRTSWNAHYGGSFTWPIEEVDRMVEWKEGDPY